MKMSALQELRHGRSVKPPADRIGDLWTPPSNPGDDEMLDGWHLWADYSPAHGRLVEIAASAWGNRTDVVEVINGKPPRLAQPVNVVWWRYVS